MADVITRLKVDSTEYDSKIKRAAEGLKAYTASCRQAGGTLEYVDKEAMDFLKSLGQMQTVSNTTKGQLRELTDSVADLRVMYSQLTQDEKSGDFGRALQESIGQLTQRAAVLRDQMDDLNEEIKHIASDTQFSDGMRLMTSTIGSCASAVVAWSGDGKKMEEVIKDLAKIQTTVAAVEALTKAFQKQNLVLLKNPYVAVAAAVAAVGVAIYEVAKNAEDAEDATGGMVVSLKKLSEAQREAETKMTSSVGQVVGRYNAMKIAWQQLSTEQEKNAWIEENSSALSQMGLNVTDINSAEDVFVNKTNSVINALKARARATAMQDLYTEKMKQAYEDAATISDDRSHRFSANRGGMGQIENDEWKLLKKGEDWYEKSEVNTLTGDLQTYRYLSESGAKKLNEYRDERYRQMIESTAKSGMEAVDAMYGRMLEGAINEQRAAEAEVSDLIKSGKSTSSTTNDGKPVKEKAPERELTGDIEKQEAEVSRLRTAWEQAVGDDARALAKQTYDEAVEELQRLRGAAEQVGDAMEAAFQPGSLDDLKNQLSDAISEMEGLTIGTDEWKEALERVRAAQDAVNDAQAKINPKVVKEQGEAASGASDNFQKAASAVSSLSGAIGQMEDPAAKIAGIIGQAVASIALTFATSLKGAVGPWDWIAASIAGVSTMVSTIAAIKSATAEYHADGGIVGSVFQPKGSDVVPAMLTPGEEVLTANDPRHRNNIGSIGGGIGALTLRTEISGESLAVVLDNNNRRRGRGKTVR